VVDDVYHVFDDVYHVVVTMCGHVLVYVGHVSVCVDHIVPRGDLLVSPDIPTEEKLPNRYSLDVDEM
jgi:hypothetical protein